MAGGTILPTEQALTRFPLPWGTIDFRAQGFVGRMGCLIHEQLAGEVIRELKSSLGMQILTVVKLGQQG